MSPCRIKQKTRATQGCSGLKLNCCWKKCQEQFHAKCAIEAGQDMLIAENDDKTSIHLLV